MMMVLSPIERYARHSTERPAANRASMKLELQPIPSH
jgi:hypothetical protein